MSEPSPLLVVEKPGHGEDIYNARDSYGTPKRFLSALDHSGLSDGWGM